MRQRFKGLTGSSSGLRPSSDHQVIKPMASLAVLFALSISALASASSTPWPSFKQLDPDGSVFEYVALQSAEEHNSTFAWLLSAVDEKAKSKYRDIDAQWQAGQLFVPCVWSRRMVLVKLSDGGVLVYSPVELLPDVELALRRLGGVRQGSTCLRSLAFLGSGGFGARVVPAYSVMASPLQSSCNSPSKTHFPSSWTLYFVGLDHCSGQPKVPGLFFGPSTREDAIWPSNKFRDFFEPTTGAVRRPEAGCLHKNSYDQPRQGHCAAEQPARRTLGGLETRLAGGSRDPPPWHPDSQLGQSFDRQSRRPRDTRKKLFSFFPHLLFLQQPVLKPGGCYPTHRK